MVKSKTYLDVNFRKSKVFAFFLSLHIILKISGKKWAGGWRCGRTTVAGRYDVLLCLYTILRKFFFLFFCLPPFFRNFPTVFKKKIWAFPMGADVPMYQNLLAISIPEKQIYYDDSPSRLYIIWWDILCSPGSAVVYPVDNQMIPYF